MEKVYNLKTRCSALCLTQVAHYSGNKGKVREENLEGKSQGKGRKKSNRK